MRFGTDHFFDTFFWHASAQPTDVSQHFRENLGAGIFFCHCWGLFHWKFKGKHDFFGSDSVRSQLIFYPLAFRAEIYSLSCFTKPVCQTMQTQTLSVWHYGPPIVLTGIFFFQKHLLTVKRGERLNYRGGWGGIKRCVCRPGCAAGWDAWQSSAMGETKWTTESVAMVIMSWRKVCDRLKISRENTNRVEEENKRKENDLVSVWIWTSQSRGVISPQRQKSQNRK